MSAELFSLKGRTALITGATNGIGQYMAVGLYEAGAEVIIIHRPSTDPEPTRKLVEESSDSNTTNVKFIQADLETLPIEDIDSQIIEKAVKLSDQGKIDILVNNAGIQYRSKFEEADNKEISKVLHINLIFPIQLTKSFGSYLIKNNIKGHVVMTCSLLSFQGGLYTVPYSTSKGGLLQFLKAIANEWAPLGIHVNGIAPGYIQTKLTKKLEVDEVRNRQISERIPYGRWGKPEDFKGPVVFLCSKASEYVFGECLVVDGGWMSR